MQQICRMLQMAGLLQSPLRTTSVLVVHLLLVQFCSGQSQLIGPHQPIVATIGDDIILPCHLEPAMDVAAKTLEWTKTNLSPRFVYVWRASQDVTNIKNPSYRGRTSLFTEELKHGNISLKLSKVNPSDEGSYKCFIPNMNTHTFIELVVASDAVSSPVIDLTGIDRNIGGVVLQCESKGWYPEPEVFWLDSEGHVLSAGPTETVRGPDGLYTVSSRVTVEKRHNNNFTCRVQQKNINQIRETQIYISDDFFGVQSSSSNTVGLAVSLSVCAVLIVLLAFFVWKWRQNINREQKNSEEGPETEPLRKGETEETNTGKGQNKSKHNQQVQQEQQRRQAAEKDLKTLKEELDTKKREVETKQDELQQLHEEKRRIETEIQNTQKGLENKKKELETTRAWFTWYNKHLGFRSKCEEKEREKKEAEDEVEGLQKKLDTHKMELDAKIKEIEAKHAEVQKLQEEILRMEADLQTLMETLTNKFKHTVAELRQKLQEEEKRRRAEEALKTKFEDKVAELQQKLREEEENKWRAVEALKAKNIEDKSKCTMPTTGPVIEVKVNRMDKYISLRNISKQDQQLRGWTLKMQLNSNNPVLYTFEGSLNLKPDMTFTIRGTRLYSTDLEWKDLKWWNYGEKLEVTLISNTQEVQHLSVHRQ